jgi:hypothetical protein
MWNFKRKILFLLVRPKQMVLLTNGYSAGGSRNIASYEKNMNIDLFKNFGA